MSDNHSDMGAGEEHETDPVDVTDDGEVELNLPREVMEEQDHSGISGATASGATMISQEERHRFEPPNGARPKWSRHTLPLLSMEEPRDAAMGATANVCGFGADRDGSPSPIFPMFQQRRQNAGVATPTRVDVGRNRDLWDPGGQQPEDGTTVDSNLYAAGQDNSVDPDFRDHPHAARGRQDLPWSPDAALMDTVARLQRDLNDMRA